MNRALYHKSLGDLGKYHTTVNSLIISLFKEDRDSVLQEKKKIQYMLDKGGKNKEQGTDRLYMVCVDILEDKYLRKVLGKKEKRKEISDEELLAQMN